LPLFRHCIRRDRPGDSTLPLSRTPRKPGLLLTDRADRCRATFGGDYFWQTFAGARSERRKGGSENSGGSLGTGGDQPFLNGLLLEG